MAQRTMIARLLATMLGFFSIGCGSSSAQDPAMQDTSVLSIDDCFVGAFFAECGGEAPPRLGCREEEGCYWFAGGNVATGFVASDCSAEDICCHEGSPYVDDRFGAALAALHLWGRKPWDRDRAMAVAVERVASAKVQSFECTGPDPFGRDPSLACSNGVATVGYWVPGDTDFYMPESTLLLGWFPIVEVDWEKKRARVCTAIVDDTRGMVCPSAEPVCATEGTVRVAASASGRIVDLDVRIGDMRLTGAFEARPPE